MFEKQRVILPLAASQTKTAGLRSSSANQGVSTCEAASGGA
jgi:hypothetical protein